MLLVATSTYDLAGKGRIVNGQEFVVDERRGRQLISKNLAALQQDFTGSDRMPGQWSEAVCIGSGPSTTPERVELIRQWRNSDRGVIVTNTSYQIALWADAVMAMDRRWWNQYCEDVAQRFEGERVTTSSDINKVRTEKLRHFGNSGSAAIAFAIRRGARRVILLGYDCHKTNGVHWHGNHPKGLTNAGSLPKWPAQFAQLAHAHADVKIINCSPDTALTCFPCASLEDVL